MACMGDVWGIYRILVGSSEVMRSLGRPRLRWKDNIEMDLKESFYVTSPFVSYIKKEYLLNVRHIQ